MFVGTMVQRAEGTTENGNWIATLRRFETGSPMALTYTSTSTTTWVAMPSATRNTCGTGSGIEGRRSNSVTEQKQMFSSVTEFDLRPSIPGPITLYFPA